MVSCTLDGYLLVGVQAHLDRAVLVAGRSCSLSCTNRLQIGKASLLVCRQHTQILSSSGNIVMGSVVHLSRMLHKAAPSATCRQVLTTQTMDKCSLHAKQYSADLWVQKRRGWQTAVLTMHCHNMQGQVAGRVGPTKGGPVRSQHRGMRTAANV